MTLLADHPVATASTLYPRQVANDPDRQSAEDFYRRGAGPSLHRQVTIRAVGPDGSLRRDWLASYLEAQINGLLRLPPGWDSYHADQVTIEAVQGAVSVVSSLASDLSVPPLVFPLPDGGLQIEWHAGRESVEIEVDGTGDAHLLVTDSNGTVLINAELVPGDEVMLKEARIALDALSARLLRQ